MRTNLTIDDDVLDRARAIASKLHQPFRKVINQALRAGLEKVEEPAKPSPYHTTPHRVRLKSGIKLDNIQELLAQIEGEEFR